MDICELNSPLVNGLIIVSGVGGLIGSFVFFMIFAFVTGAEREPILSREFLYTGIMTGIAERFLFTMFIGLMGYSGIASASIGWVAIKGQVHYKIFTDSDRNDLPKAYLGLLATLSSLVFAIVGGYVWREGIYF
ncbi:MAG: hypothetical protein CMK89_20145 [Pseudomonadales bacterium]|nr:hypothetical protein [Pseudomonadales bacterium]